MGWTIPWDGPNDAVPTTAVLLAVRGLAAWTLSVQTGLTPERADEIIGDEVVSFARVTPAGMAAIMQSAYERAQREGEP